MKKIIGGRNCRKNVGGEIQKLMKKRVGKGGSQALSRFSMQNAPGRGHHKRGIRGFLGGIPVGSLIEGKRYAKRRRSLKEGTKTETLCKGEAPRLRGFPESMQVGSKKKAEKQ